MKTRIFLLAIPNVIFLFLLSQTACRNKDTVVHGRVIDKVTGEGLDSVSVSWYEVEHPDKITGQNAVYTDKNGEFQISSEEYNIDIFWVNDKKKSSSRAYMSIFYGAGLPEIKKNKFNEVEIGLIPMDGVLKVTIHNTSVKDTVYVAVFGPSIASQVPVSLGYFLNRPVEVLSMTTTTITPIYMPSKEPVNIYWSLTPWATVSSIMMSPNNGFVEILQGDTTYFQIDL
jgi:hypothetical protein